jgi:hypothetical protein
MNFHDFYAIEAMIAPLFFIFALIRFNNKRTKGNLILLLLLLSLLLASIHYGLFMSAFYWVTIFTVLLVIFNASIIKDTYHLLLNLLKTKKGEIIAGLLLLLIISGIMASWLPFYYNSGHVLRYRGWDRGIPVGYDAAGSMTNETVPIVSSEIWTILFGWLPFPDIHDNLLSFAWHGHENRYIGLVTLPLIFTALTLCLKNRYTYILFLTYLLCNAFIIYATDNIVYKILTDNSDIFRNIANMSTIFPRGGPLLFLIFLAGVGLDRLVGIATKNETIEEKDLPFTRLFKITITVLTFVACALLLASVMVGFWPMFLWLRHSLSHIGIYLLIFSFICRILIISNNKIIRRAILFCLLLFTFTDLTVSASSIILTPRPFQPGDVYSYMLGNTLVPYNMLSEVGAIIPDNAVFRPVNSISDQMFPENYRGAYHNADRIHWSTKEWLVLATREDGMRFLPNWDPRHVTIGRLTTVRMTQYPTFQLFSNGYYLPFEKIRELDTDKSIYDAEPLFYLHDEQLVNSKRTHPQEPIHSSYATLKEYTPNKAIIEITTDRDGFLYFLDNYDRFWSAYVDGKKVKIHRANFTFKAIELPAGTHTVSWVYNPYPVKIAYSIYYLLLSLTFIIMIYPLLRSWTGRGIIRD